MAIDIAVELAGHCRAVSTRATLGRHAFVLQEGRLLQLLLLLIIPAMLIIRALLLHGLLQCLRDHTVDATVHYTYSNTILLLVDILSRKDRLGGTWVHWWVWPEASLVLSHGLVILNLRHQALVQLDRCVWLAKHVSVVHEPGV